MSEASTLALRLAGPLQSWGTTSQFNRRGTEDRPSKAGLIGLLAAAQGRHRGASLEDLVDLTCAVRVDQPGSILHDYHTASTLDGSPLLSAKVNTKGWQVATSPKKLTHITRRSYLEDAVFLALVSGPPDLLESLREALLRPRFALALGRRSCPPSPPILVPPPTGTLWEGYPRDLVSVIPWQAGDATRARFTSPAITVAVTFDDPTGLDQVADVPMSFDQRRRRYATRRVTHDWISIPTGIQGSGATSAHDPFELLGW